MRCATWIQDGRALIDEGLGRLADAGAGGEVRSDPQAEWQKAAQQQEEEGRFVVSIAGQPRLNVRRRQVLQGCA